MNKTSHNALTARAMRISRLAPVLACIFTVLGLPVHAAVSLPDTPMQTNNGVPPNLWFILDDSGSMSFIAMPRDRTDYPNANNPGITAMADNVRDRSYINNSIYYDPSKTYQAWKRADGTRFTTGVSFTAVHTHPTKLRRDVGDKDWSGRDIVDRVVDPDDQDTEVQSFLPENLSTQDQVYYVPRPGVANPGTTNSNYYRFRIISAGAATDPGRIQRCQRNTANTAWNASCTLTTAFTTAAGRTEAAEKANYAIWYSYHRTRMKVAKAGVTEAFNDTDIFNADSKYRVGFTTIHDRNTFRIPVATNNGLFEGNTPGDNRHTWFERLLDAKAQSGTPLIPALARAGEYFEETDENSPWGPQVNGSQFQCRQNFSILTTDGFWNSGDTDIGNADGVDGGSIAAPDGSTYTYDADSDDAKPRKDSIDNTLADVAMYFWKRDLRPETQMKNTVPTSPSNPAFWQHMVTFGISIGLKGTLDVAVTNGKVDRKEAVNWPDPTDKEDEERIDDLFHASVNGRGDFVAASNPTEFAEGLGSALRAISSRRGSGSNATVTGTSVDAGNRVFQAKYFTAAWFGELQAFDITTAGAISTAAAWTAGFPALASRQVFTHNGTAGAAFPTTPQTAALTANVAAYIRGDRTKEIPATGGIFRERSKLLGTIVNSSPTFIKTSSTVQTVYVGANDGMLHAFNASNGIERFGYVPAGVNLTWLREFSDPDYGHRFFVDGAIVTSTPRELTNQTVLVSALGRGGKGLFALDVTDPTAFNATKVLWDRSGGTDADMGQILGKPLIAKLNNGQTAVIVPNGLNSPSEDAVLLVYNLTTGALLARINTGADTDNGLSSPRGWDEDGNGTVDFVYAGDFKGSVWKFDLRSGTPSVWSVNKRLYSPGTVTTKPITGGVTIAVDPASGSRWVFFGTGRLLTTTDITDTALQTWHGVIDEETTTTAVTRANMTARNIAQSVLDPVRKVFNRAFEPNTALPTNSKGWYIDLDLPPSNTLEGERMVGDQQVVKNALIAASIIPSTNNPCEPGRGFINAVDAFTGTSLSTGLFDVNRDGTFGGTADKIGNDAIGSIDLGVGMVTDPALLDRLLVAGGSLATLASTPLDPTLYGGRISWRELIRR